MDAWAHSKGSLSTMTNFHHDSNRVPKSEVDPASGQDLGQGQTGAFTFSSIPYNPASVPPPDSTDRRPLPLFEAQAANPTPVPSHIHTAAQRRENAKARRRVPTSQRKRTKLSCDACKAKRCKCLRSGPSPDADDAQDDSHLVPCKNCVDAGIDCVTTLPRKQRIYGSVEQLDRRYRALDALVSGLLPDLPSDATADDLVEYGRQHGLAMPDLGQDSDASKSPATTIPTLVSPIAPSTTGVPIGEEGPDPERSNTYFLKDTNGKSHYIGPAGSLASFARIRELIARRLYASGDPDAGRRGRHVTSGLVTDTIARSFDETSGNIALPPQEFPDTSSLPGHFLEEKGRSTSDPNMTSESRFWVAISKIRLPRKELADACVNAFFKHVHPDFMIIHRPTFDQHYNDMWNSSARRPSGASFSAQRETRVSVGWLCCLYLMFILGSRSLTQNAKSIEFQRTWYDAVKDMPSLLVGSNLPNVSALMLLSLYYQSTNDRTKSWVYLGAACRIAIALGLHHECTNEGFEPLVIEIRKRVWWTLYDYEQHLCCSLGRPSAIDDLEVNVGIPDEQMLQCIPALPRAYMEAWVHLSRLQAQVRREVHIHSSTAASVIPQALNLLRQLSTWKEELPQFLLPTSPELAHRDPGKWRRITILHVKYEKLVNLLTRRFLLEEVESVDKGEALGVDGFIIVKLGKVCVTSAMRCVQLLVCLWSADQFNGVSALDTYYSYLCSIQICLRLLEPSCTQLPSSFANDGSEAWKFQSHEPRVEGMVGSPSSRMDFEADALITQRHLVDDYSVADLTEAIRRIHDILKTVSMSGFSAKCEAIASEFAKAVGAVDGKPLSGLFSGQPNRELGRVADHMKQADHPSRRVPLSATPLFNGISTSDSPNLPSGHLSPGFPQLAMSTAQDVPMPMASQASTNMMNYVYSGVVDASMTGDSGPFQQPQVQWDIVQPAEDWSDHNSMFMDMGTNNWAWPHETGFPFGNMEQPR